MFLNRKVNIPRVIAIAVVASMGAYLLMSAAVYWDMRSLALRLESDRQAPSTTVMPQATPTEVAPPSVLQDYSAASTSDSTQLTFAKPLPLPGQELLLFEIDGQNIPAIWRYSWETGLKQEVVSLSGLSIAGSDRFTALKTDAGIWLIGPRLYLIRADKKIFDLPLAMVRPVAVPTADGSIWLLGNSAVERNQRTPGRIVRLSFDGTTVNVEDKGLMSYDGLAEQPGKSQLIPTFGHKAVALNDGRILIVGGDQTPQLAAVFDPSKLQMQPLSNMPHERVHPAIALLPDGRVVVAGGCTTDQAVAVDVLDLKARANPWSQFAALPFPLCSEAASADGPSIAVASDNTLIVGGHLETHVMTLKPEPNSATGYAARWTVRGSMAQQRIGGVIQPLTAGKVGIAGGVQVLRDTGSCCLATKGTDQIVLSDEPPALASYGLAKTSPITAINGERIFVAGGRNYTAMHSNRFLYSRLVELIDLHTGRVTQLAPLPFDSAAGEAVWLDDTRVLIKPRTAVTKYGNAIDSGFFQTEGVLGVYDTATGGWTQITSKAAHFAAGKLLGVQNGIAALFAPTGEFFAYSIKGKTVEVVELAIGKRTNGSMRWLNNGRVTVAGGATQQDMISVADDCQGAGQKDVCPEQFVGFGVEGVPSQWHESAQTKIDNGALRFEPWTTGPRGFTAGGSVAILEDGRLFKASQELVPEQLNRNPSLASEPIVIERSDVNATKWQLVPLPTEGGGVECGDHANDCKLLVATDPRNEKNELLFLLAGAIDADGMEYKDLNANVWWFDPDSESWHWVLAMPFSDARSVPQDFFAPLSSKKLRMRSLGWHLERPFLWVQE